EELGVLEYRCLGTNIYQGAEATAILAEGANKHPESVSLRTDYMELLAKAGQREEAWKAYQMARDLYFAAVDRMKASELRRDANFLTEPLTVLIARPWYVFLLREGKDDELRRLENRLREACSKTKEEPKNLVLVRAFADFGSGRHADAVASLEICFREKLWNE